MGERNKKIRNKVIVIIILLDLFFLGLFAIPYDYKDYNDIEVVIVRGLTVMFILIVIFMDGILFKLLTHVFNSEEDDKESKKFVEDNLSTERYVGVVPIKSNKSNKSNKYEDFILGLTDIAKFYAVINEKEEKVEIMLKFNGEEKYRSLEKLDKEYFNYYYKLKQEKELETSQN